MCLLFFRECAYCSSGKEKATSFVYASVLLFGFEQILDASDAAKQVGGLVGQVDGL